MARSKNRPRATPMPMPALAPVLRPDEAEAAVEEDVEDAEAGVLVSEAVAEGREAELEIVRPVGAAVEEVRPKSWRSFCWYSIVMGCAELLLVWVEGDFVDGLYTPHCDAISAG